VVTNLCVLDFKSAAGCARLVSLHPGVTLEEVKARTGFPFECVPEVPATREPTQAELRLIDELDPTGLRYGEVPA
jgi:acyl CoA:acetate/3-ketoacid CoA transferase beta subunit